MFELLGFVEEVVDRDSTLKPPATDLSSPVGKQSRRKLLRAWLEFSAWLTDFKRVNGKYTLITYNCVDNSPVLLKKLPISRNGRTTRCMCNLRMRVKSTKRPLVHTLIRVCICDN